MSAETWMTWDEIYAANAKLKKKVEEYEQREQNIKKFWDVQDNDFEVIATRKGKFLSDKRIE